MKMRFWQKTYLLTLILFLLCLNLGILSLTMYTHRKNVENAETSAKASQNYAALSFERDYNFLENDSNVVLLMQSYGNHYKKDTFLCFVEDGETLYTSFPSEYDIQTNSIRHMDIHEKRHIIISSQICGGKYTFVYAKNYGYIDDEFKSLMTIYFATSLCVSLLLAVCLYFVLKKLSVPLEKLKETTKSIEEGDFSVRAHVVGEDEFASLAGSFNSMLEKINEQIEALELDSQKKQMLVDNMAHELRTPLTSIYGYAELLEKASISEEKRIIASKYIMSESKRLQKISEMLLDTAFVRENGIEKKNVDISLVVKDVCEKLSAKAEKSRVKICVDMSENIALVNETLISMLFYNLIENAIKACDEGGRVRVYNVDGKITVEDNGKGMTKEQLARITEPFYRTDKSRSRAEGGAGLGLALCKEIADTHGIDLVFESELNVGTKVSVDFTTLIQD